MVLSSPLLLLFLLIMIMMMGDGGGGGGGGEREKEVEDYGYDVSGVPGCRHTGGQRASGPYPGGMMLGMVNVVLSSWMVKMKMIMKVIVMMMMIIMEMIVMMMMTTVVVFSCVFWCWDPGGQRAADPYTRGIMMGFVMFVLLC